MKKDVTIVYPDQLESELVVLISNSWTIVRVESVDYTVKSSAAPAVKERYARGSELESDLRMTEYCNVDSKAASAGFRLINEQLNVFASPLTK